MQTYFRMLIEGRYCRDTNLDNWSIVNKKQLVFEAIQIVFDLSTCCKWLSILCVYCFKGYVFVIKAINLFCFVFVFVGKWLFWTLNDMNINRWSFCIARDISTVIYFLCDKSEINISLFISKDNFSIPSSTWIFEHLNCMIHLSIFNILKTYYFC